ncbi:MAG: CoA ester lyase [Gammaproteobacteria bacterium]|nr:CoA ester lyase [Gammaproteobacteria bacterium]MBU2676340.1 CoA ester lyase [Gammaproteobacteria bacterium]NNC57918.1 CoA ester lyase [Woeseiaceae bacterium]NNL50074.1 CoA ester lyase [Woeseiaceae bacterium]
MNRSFLFVPADSERKLQKAADAGADALILDLEDAVAAEARPAARQMAADYLQGKQNIWVRINPFDTEDAHADLEAVMPSAPTGIVLPKPRSAADAIALSRRIDVLEQKHQIEAGQTRIIALCTERPEALFTLSTYAGATERLSALSWGAEDLSAAVGASANRDRDGNWLPTFEMARSLCLLAAAAAEVTALDTVFTDFRDHDGLLRYAANARRDGFSGMLAIHPAQIEAINAAFVPSSAEVEHAQRIVELFEANPGAGTLGMDGKMIDRPHLIHAQRTLKLAKHGKRQ